MSNLSAIGLILGVLIAGTLVMAVATHIVHLRGDAITTGVVRGVSVSIKERWMILFVDWIPASVAMGVFGLILALGHIAIAENVVDRNTQILAWLCAALAGFASAFWFILGTSYLIHCVATLREAERS